VTRPLNEGALLPRFFPFNLSRRRTMQITRKIQSNTAAFIVSALIALAVTPPAIAASDNATLTIGRVTAPLGGCPVYKISGYVGSGGPGSYSPTGLTGGQAVAQLADHHCGGNALATTLSVTGFSVDPGQLWLTSVTCNGVTKTAAAASFSYSSGNARWTWSAASFGLLTPPVGTNVSCTIVHN
jgi:hypothetical protein